MVRSVLFHLQAILILALPNIVVAETNAQSRETREQSRIPILLNRDSYQQPFAKLSKIAREEWKFDGIEVSLESLVKEAGGAEKLEAFLVEAKQAVGPDFVISLNLKPGFKSKDIQIVTQNLRVTSFAISLAGLEPKSTGVIVESVHQLATCSPNIPVVVEAPSVSSGVDVRHFSEVTSDVPPDVGLLIAASHVHYRFDLSLQDFRTGGGLSDGAEVKRPIAIRFRCNATDLSASESAQYRLEVFRRALSEQIIPHRAQSRPLFVSVEAASPIALPASPNSAGQFGIGSKTFRDMIVAIRSEISAAR